MKNNSNNKQTMHSKMASRWARIAHGVKKQKAAVLDSCNHATQILEDELFDGIFLNLSCRNSVKSYSEQKRILRRIIEKRQAQLAHRQVGRTGNRFTSHFTLHSTSKSIGDLYMYQMCG